MSVWLTNIRFNTDRPVYKEAYEYLMNMDRDKYKSFSNVIAHAVLTILSVRRKEALIRILLLRNERTFSSIRW